MKITLAQLNPTVGDICGNVAKVTQTLSQCRKDSPDLVVFPELFLVGYPPRDLLERPSFIARTNEAIRELSEVSQKYPHTGIIVGAPQPGQQSTGKGLHNSALLLYQGRILFTQHKSLLPTYDVFDEPRYFDPATEDPVVQFKDKILGISICEDAWNDPALWHLPTYSYDPIEVLAEKGANLIINIAASPFYRGKETLRYNIVRSHATKHRIPFLFINQVGANDELIFDGRSVGVDGAGDPFVVFPPFEEHVQTISVDRDGIPDSYVPQEEIASVYQALVLGVRDYMRKCGFTSALVGLSGGIDSAVTCCIAIEAIGAKNVVAVTMPGPYSSTGSIEDSRKLAENLAIRFEVIPISPAYEAYMKSLQDHFKGREPDITEENFQARIRGNILMALSNKFGHLVLSTGNKSELAVGYCTLYGDMSGGLSVIADVPKTMVYELARYINRDSTIIPEEIVNKSPSAELRENQTDQDTLPPYEVLDEILHYYVDEHYSMADLLQHNFDPETVKWVIQTVDRNEYKRRQAVPGLKVTSKAFGMGRRMPIAAKFDN
ncbi:MAG: NAD+ synthase [Deltaproteobacteria bacterium]|jgi:NAD+ synthase (glutamine-hydrolysing)|nr:NAD+ synthase [Deltaproteobacteria bacterium]